MKPILLLFFTCFVLLISGQILEPGNYVGNSSLNQIQNLYTVTVKQNGNVITIIEPNRTSEYESTNGVIYWHKEPKYSQIFYVRVVNTTSFYAGKKNEGEGLYTFQENITNEKEVLSSGIDNCPIYDKYVNLTETDPKDIQGWAFCGAAALVKCTYTDFSGYLIPIIKGLKSITENPAQCPCTDAITQQEWNTINSD